MMALPTLIVEAQLGGSPGDDYLLLGDSTRGKLGVGKLAPQFAGTDISQWVLTLDIERGRQRLLEEYSAGQATIVLRNTDGRFDPANLNGPYVSGGVSLLRPMVRVRVRATWAGVTYDLFHGFADAWEPRWELGGRSGVCVLTVTDGFKVLSAFDPSAESSPQGAGESTGERIDRILDMVGWPATDRDIDAGNSTCQATTLGKNALAEINEVALSEGGYFYISADGKATFRDRHSRIEDTRSIQVQATYDDDGTDLPYADVRVIDDAELVKNIISATRIGGAAQEKSDSASISFYLKRPYVASNLWHEDDVETANWASWALQLFKDHESRVESITVYPESNPAALWPVVLGAQFGDLVLVIRRPAGAGYTSSKHVFVEGIAHRWSADQPTWQTVFRFSSATKLYQQWLILGSTVSGQLGVGKLAPY